MIDHPEAGTGQNIRRQPEINNVEDVEKLGSKLQFRGLAVQRRFLHQGDVEVAKSRSIKSIAAQGPEASLVWSGAAGDVDGNRKIRAIRGAHSEIVSGNGMTRRKTGLSDLIGPVAPI